MQVSDLIVPLIVFSAQYKVFFSYWSRLTTSEVGLVFGTVRSGGTSKQKELGLMYLAGLVRANLITAETRCLSQEGVETQATCEYNNQLMIMLQCVFWLSTPVDI